MAYGSRLMYGFWQMPADRQLLLEPSSPNSDRDAAHFILKTLLQQSHEPFAAGGYRRPRSASAYTSLMLIHDNCWCIMTEQEAEQHSVASM